MSMFRAASTAAAILILAPVQARADVCVAVDEAHDTLRSPDRASALILLTREFESAGERVVASCAEPFLVSHVTLGRRILVTMDGPGGRREGTALGLEDLPALYSQMVRSIVTGKPMTGFNVIDR